MHERLTTAEIGQVPSTWRIEPLREFLDLVTYGFTNPMPTTSEGPWKLTAADIVDGRIVWSGARHTSHEAFDNDLTDKSRPLIGDVLLTKDGSIGRVAVVDRSAVCINQSVALLRPNRNILPHFLLYLLASPHYQRRMAQDADGTTILHIYITRVDKMQVAVPPINEQRGIIGVMRALDDKIELNRRMNETLEAIARAIFKSWFVDFDPVRAKAEGRKPAGVSGDLAALFPSAFVQSEIGNVPAGWNVQKLSELCSTQYGYTASATEVPIGPKFLRVTDINKIHWIDWSSVPYCPIEEADLRQYALHAGDIVVARMADPGKSAIIDDEIPAVFASYLVRLQTSSLAQADYVYGFLKSELYAEYSEGAKSGSVQANMNAQVIVGARLLVPPQSVIEAHSKLVRPLRQRTAANLRESHTLAMIRDTLLPKLLSGKIRVKEAERALEATT